MTKKKINMALLIIVLGLWGTVIYKYVSHFFISPEVENFHSNNNVNSKLKNSVKDTFELKPLERDPFLAINYKKPKPVAISYKTRSDRKAVKKEPISVIKKPFPRIIYYGHILSNEKKKETILLSVGGKFIKVSLNEEKEKIKVTNFTRDSIKVSFEKESQWVRIKK